MTNSEAREVIEEHLRFHQEEPDATLHNGRKEVRDALQIALSLFSEVERLRKENKQLSDCHNAELGVCQEHCELVVPKMRREGLIEIIQRFIYHKDICINEGKCFCAIGDIADAILKG